MIRSRTLLLVALSAIGACLGAAGLAPYARRAHTLHPKTGAPLTLPGKDGDTTLLFNGWRISPAGRLLPTGDMLLGGALSPDGKTLAIANCGYNDHALHLIDIESEKETARLPVPRAWNGIAWSPDGNTLYVSGGIAASVQARSSVYDISLFKRDTDGKWSASAGFNLRWNDPKETCVAGLTLSRDGKTLFALNNSDGRLYILDAVTGVQKARMGAAEKPEPLTDHPLACKLSSDGNRLYVTGWGASEVVVLDIQVPEEPLVLNRIKTGQHPNDIALSRDGRMFVSCGNENAVYAYDEKALRPLEVIRTSLTPNSPPGSTPNALAVTPDSHTLYIANADNNAVCVVDVSRRGKSQIRGFIPTGWYPSAVAVSSDGRKVIIGSGKGTGTGPNALTRPLPAEAPGGFQHHGHQLRGLLAFLDAPTDAQLADFTRQVLANAPYHDSQLRVAESDRHTAIPNQVGAPSPIKYVLYIIKENRTYDQVFGDLPQGNGDPSLVLFGRDVTPNHHALAEQFVLLDNLYCSGEVSADGHPWSTSATANDFVERSWVLSYSGKGQTHFTEEIATPRSGFLWDACARKGLSYRSYGEYIYAASSEKAPVKKLAGARGLLGHGSEKYVGVGRPDKAPEMRDMEGADIFIEEFKEFERKNQIPRFMIMSLGEDHTSGTTPGSYTPKACVASNDQALGKIVDTISHSRVWNQFAIFVIEDDAQNGPDHVDSHRTAGLVISPYTRRHTVDSTMYATTSLLRTMELILGLPPLTQYDAAATPMFASFTDTPDLTPYTLLPPQIALDTRNKTTAYGAAQSAKMDFRGYDRVDEDALNRILWHSIKGANVPMPPPNRRALLTANGRLHASPVPRDADD